jgi:putative hemolysin
LKRIPETGESFKFDKYRFEVVDMDGRKIDKLLVTRPSRRRPEGAESASAT